MIIKILPPNLKITLRPNPFPLIIITASACVSPMSAIRFRSNIEGNKSSNSMDI